MLTLTGTRGRARHRFVKFAAAALAVPLAGVTACSSRDADAAAEVVGTGDEYEATIRRTEGGVPHITGASLADVSFGQGWASGEDRTCDLADQVMKINGDRSLWLGRGEGDANLDSDIAWRSIGLMARAMEDWINASPRVIELVTGFADGWNAQLAHVGTDAITGWCAGAEWLRPLQPVEVYAYARAVALQASSGALVGGIARAQPPGGPPDREVDNPPAPPAHEEGTGTTPTTAGRRAPGGPAAAGEAPGPFAISTAPGTAEGLANLGAASPAPDSPDRAPGSDDVAPGPDEPGSGGAAGGPTAGNRDTGASVSGPDDTHSGAAAEPPTGASVSGPDDTHTGAAAEPPTGAGIPDQPARGPVAARSPGGGGGGGRADVGAPFGVGGRAASSGWAIGRERSAGGGGMLLADPAFGWEGEQRLWEVHLTVPGELDVYGAQLSGLPGVLVGFNEDVAWTHTVSPGHRFTAYRLELVPGEPTTYRYGEEVRGMEPTEVTVDVLDEDGSIDQVTRTMWSTHYGPVVGLPGLSELGWTEATAVSYRDANLDDDELLDQYLAMAKADDLDELIAAHRSVGGVPLFATVATSRDGRAWYADTSATPNLSPVAVGLYEASAATDRLVARAADRGVVLLDGSEPVFEWIDADGARDPGLVPLSQLPELARDDYVFNAGDSFWLPHAEATVEGAYSPLHGDQATARSPRTRRVATLLADTSADGPAGDDGRFTLDELAAAALDDRGYTAQALLDAVVDRCDGAPQVFLPRLPGAGEAPDLPPAGIYVGAACAVLAGWDGTYDVDQAGPPLWREMMHQMGTADAAGTGRLWARPFDPGRPVTTPSGLAPAPASGRDPVLDALARAVQILDLSGIAVDATLGDLQFAQRGDQSVPVPGGDAADGTATVVGAGNPASILDPQLAAVEDERQPVAARSPLGRYGDVVGYLVDGGTSLVMAVELTGDGPRARTRSPYPSAEDRRRDDHAEATRRFADGDWRDVAFTPDEVASQTTETLIVRG